MIVSKKSIDKIFFAGFLATWVIFSFVSCTRSNNAVEIRQGEFRKTVLISGSLEAKQSEQFTAPLTDSWRIQIKWMVSEGQAVKADDVVVRFDTANLSGEIEKCQMDLKSKDEEIKQKRIDHDFQRRQLQDGVQQAEVERQKRAIDALVPEEIITRLEYDQNQYSLKRSELEKTKKQREEQLGLNEMATQMAQMELDHQDIMARLERLNRQLSAMTFKANRPGTVIYGIDPYKERKVQPGDTVTATTTVAVIPNAESLYVEAWAAESDLQYLKSEQPVDLVLDAMPERCWKGKVKAVLSKGEKKRVWGACNLFRVEIEMIEKDLDMMKPGMSVRCEIPVMKISRAWLVPLSLAHFAGDHCWIKRVGKPIERIKQLGMNDFTAAVAVDSFASDSKLVLLPIQEADVNNIKNNTDKGAS